MADEPNLFGVKKKVPKPKVLTPSGAMQRLIGLHKTNYERRFSEPPVITKRDGQMLKTLVLKFGETTVGERLTAYHALEDEWVATRGYDIYTFYNSWARLAAQAKAKPKKESVPDAVETLRRLRG